MTLVVFIERNQGSGMLSQVGLDLDACGGKAQSNNDLNRIEVYFSHIRKEFGDRRHRTYTMLRSVRT